MSTAEVIKFNPKEGKVADLDNGYTRIANDLLEAFVSHPFTSRQYKILISVVLKTYRFHKKLDWIANSQFEKLSGLPSTTCSTVKNELIQMGVLISNGRECGINANISEWKVKVNQNNKCFTKTVKKSFTKTVNAPLPKQSNTKETFTKEIIKKEKIYKKEISPKSVKTSFPENLTITESNQKLANELGLNAEFEFGKFRDRNLALGGKYVDWNSAFSGWLRKAYEYKHGGKKPTPTVHPKQSGMTPERQREYDQYLFMNGLAE